MDLAKNHASALFVRIDKQLQVSLTEVLAKFPAMMKRKGTRHAADPWVVALARLVNATVVTREGVVATEANPSIPLVCSAFGVTSVPLRDLIRREGWKFQSG